MKSHNCENRNDIVGQSIDTEWHACPGDTWLHILQKLQEFMWRPGTHLRVFHAGSSSRACSATSPTGKASKCNLHKCLAQVKEVAHVRGKIQTWLLVFCGPGPEQTWADEERPSHQYSDPEWGKFALIVTMSELFTRKHPALKCSNIIQRGAVMKRKKGGGVGTHF